MKKNVNPPRLAQRIFRWYCEKASVEDLEGDLEELFFENVKKMSPARAKSIYWAGMISLIFSYAVKSRKKKASVHPFATSGNNFAMLQNYIKVSVRGLSKNKLFTFINTVGLAVGMSIALLLIAMLSFVSHYDNFHSNRNKIYRITTQVSQSGRSDNFASSPAPLANKIQQELPFVEAVIRINKTFEGEILLNSEAIPVRGYFADPGFLTLFTFPVLRGNPGALANEKNIVITQKAGKKLFGEDDPIGKTIQIQPWGEFIIGAVLKDIPKNSHLSFEVLAPYSVIEQSIESLGKNSWIEFRNNYTYLSIPEAQDAGRVKEYLSGKNIPENPDKNLRSEYHLQSLPSIVPGPDLYNAIGPSWDYQSFAIFGVLTLLILVPACFNYTNISISRTIKRAKEIGLRKTVGGQQSQIFYQFLTETIIISLVALAGAFLIFRLIRSEFLSMIVSSDAMDLSTDLQTILLFVAFAVLVGVAAGIVPAVYFSKVNAIQALKNTASIRGGRSFSIRKTLVVFQFTLSLGFIMAVVIVLKQYNATMSYDFGFSQENILDVELQDVKPNVFESEFSKLSSVANLSFSSGIPGTGKGVSQIFVYSQDGNDSTLVDQLFTDHRFLENLNLNLVAGEGFENKLSNENSMIVNEQLVKALGFTSPHEALGKSFFTNDTLVLRIVGVVKDFHYMDLREPIGNFCFRFNPNEFRYANLKVESTDMFSSVSEMEKIWRGTGSGTKFKSRFFDDEIEEAYSFYFGLIKICGFLGFLAITISCLGLLGMVVYTAETRTKEIGIRKVMGASSLQLAYLLSIGYMKLIVIAAFIATPATVLIFEKGLLPLQYYRFEIGFWEVFVSVGSIFFLGLVTIFSQTVKASHTNPVDTLRSE